MSLSAHHPWFTVEKIDDNTYAISEYHHWEQVHSYLLLGADQALLIDTGLGVAPMRPVVEALTKLPVQVVTTHVHWDHIGGHGEFDQRAVHALEAPWLNGAFPLPPQVVRNNLTREPCSFPPGFSPDTYRVFQGIPTRILQDGDRIELGIRSLVALHTPGHSPGHLCFFEPKRGWLFTGDLAYGGKLDMFYPSTDPQAFLSSVRKMAALDVARLFPGHYGLDVSAAFLGEVAEALGDLNQKNILAWGSGIFSYPGFSIHL